MARLYSRAKHPIVALITSADAQVQIIVVGRFLGCFVGQRIGLLAATPDTEDLMMAARATGFPDIPS